MAVLRNVPGLVALGGLQQTLALSVRAAVPLASLLCFPSLLTSSCFCEGHKGAWCIGAGLAASEAVSSVDTRVSFGSSRLWGGFCWVFAFLSWTMLQSGGHSAMRRS